jgi:glucan phosphoethanolaminetransferase (alkaline phosphatase superfamily)
MKDIVIPSQKVKREAYVFLGCFIFAFLLNIAAIIIYKTPWYEAFTQIGYVIVIAVVLYLIMAFIRFFIYLIKQLFKQKTKQ